MKMWNKSIHSLLIAVVFIALIVTVSLIFQALGQLFMKYDPYKMPRGHAIKVFQQDESEVMKSSMMDKLMTFYLYGEN